MTIASMGGRMSVHVNLLKPKFIPNPIHYFQEFCGYVQYWWQARSLIIMKNEIMDQLEKGE
jgi:hypothetical protein